MILPWMYAAVFVGLLLYHPFLYLDNHLVFRYIVVAINTGIFATISYFIHSQHLSAWRGLRLLCGSFMSGCGNLTIIYIFFVLFYYYLQALIKTIQGIIKGREFTQTWWLQTVSQRIESGGWNIFKR